MLNRFFKISVLNIICPLVFLIFYSINALSATVGEELASPVITPAAPVFLASTLMSAFLWAKQDDVSKPATSQASHDRPLKNFSVIGDFYGQVYPNALYVVGMLGYSYLADSNKAWYKASHMAKSTLYAIIVVSAMKYAVREHRPDNPKERNSFPSGHTTTAFAFASTVAMEHNVYLGTAALLMAGFTAYSRMNDGRHYLHDVTAGMTIGIGYGMGIYYTERRKFSYSLVPIIGPDVTGLRLVKAF